MPSLSTNLKKLIEQFHLTPTKLGRLTGVPQSVIHQITSGKNRNPKIETLKPLCAYFRISISQLIGEIALPNESPDPNIIYNWRNIPIIHWQDAIDWPATRQRYLNDPSTQYFFANPKTSDRSYALVLDNHAMEPLLTKGTHLVADPDRKAKSGNFVVVHFVGKQTACLKQIIMDETNWKLISPNMKIIDDRSQLMLEQTSVLAVIIGSQFDFY